MKKNILLVILALCLCSISYGQKAGALANLNAANIIRQDSIVHILYVDTNQLPVQTSFSFRVIPKDSVRWKQLNIRFLQDTLKARSAKGDTAYGWGTHTGLYPTYNGTGATSNWSINITGNSATVTDGVYLTGNYSNPPWISDIPWSKITGYPGTLSGYGIIDAYPLSGNPSGFLTSFSETDPLFNVKFAAKTTTDLTEGSNLYYTISRFNGAFSSKTTADLPEGFNLYFTNARVSSNTDVAANTAARHSPVTIGTSNGLSLSVQSLSLGLASTSTNGALSSVDWNVFNNKLSSEVDGSVTNEIQTISRSNGTVTLSLSGGSFNLPDSSALNEIELPSQTGNANKHLTTNGTTPSWVLVKRQETPSGNTDSNGDIIITYSSAFAAAPNVQPSFIPTNDNQFFKILSNSTTGCTVRILERTTDTILGIVILRNTTTAVSGKLVDILVTEK